MRGRHAARRTLPDATIQSLPEAGGLRSFFLTARGTDAEDWGRRMFSNGNAATSRSEVF